jgi:hypothetical protein
MLEEENKENSKELIHAYWVRDNLFELTGLRPASIRDQIWRSEELVKSLIQAKRISSEHPLLILGGGAAGASAALTAAKSGILAVVIEQEDGLFTTQLDVSTRYIDPVEYDWPATHWREGKFPYGNRISKGLKMTRASAHELAIAWTAQMDSVVAEKNLPLIVAFGHDARNLKLASDETGIKIEYQEQSRTGKSWTRNFLEQYLKMKRPWVIDQIPTFFHEKDANISSFEVIPKGKHLPYAHIEQICFGAAISCIGIGKEVVGDPLGAWNYTGPLFWSADNLGLPYLGTGLKPSATRPIRALISGGGDGAQQDFLRLLTNTSGRLLLDAIRAKFASAGEEWWQLFENLQNELATHERSNREKDFFEMSKSEQGQLLSEWHAHFNRLLSDFFGALDTAVIDQISKGIFRPEIIEQSLRVTWILRNSCLSYCYGLNRLLSTLLLHLYAHQCKCKPVGQVGSANPFVDCVVLSGGTIESIQPNALEQHPNCEALDVCYGQEHMIRLRSDSDSTASISLVADVIIIRHGLSSKPLFGVPPAPNLQPFF